MMKCQKIHSRGFTYPEMLVVVVIIALVFFAAIPLYKQFNTLNELKNTAQKIRDDLRLAQNKASSGVTATNGTSSHWVVQLRQNGSSLEYASGACPVLTDTSVTGYSGRYNFNACPNRSNHKFNQFPDRFSVSHQYAGNDEVNIFFSSINGSVTVYDSNGILLGNAIDVRIDSNEYPAMYIVLRVNQTGSISEERQSN